MATGYMCMIRPWIHFLMYTNTHARIGQTCTFWPMEVDGVVYLILECHPILGEHNDQMVQSSQAPCARPNQGGHADIKLFVYEGPVPAVLYVTAFKSLFLLCLGFLQCRYTNLPHGTLPHFLFCKGLSLLSCKYFCLYEI